MIWSIRKISFNKIRAIANDFVSDLTEDEKDELWEGLKRGKALLRTDAELKYYLYAYGKMHQQKMKVALSHFSWEDFENRRIQVVDWGCGQALATICFFDYLRKKDIKCEIEKIVLIEPSKEALNRAKTHVCAYDNYVWEETDIETLNKYIDQVNLSEIESNADLTIHFFANVLDIPNIKLSRLAKIVKKASDNETFVICMGPNNNFNERIDKFFSYFHDYELLYEDEHDKTNEYDYTAKYCIFALNKKKDDFISKWIVEGEKLCLSEKELNLVVECKAKCYKGEGGDFTKLFLSIEFEGKKLTLKDNGRVGIELDATSTKRLGLSGGEEVDVDPAKVLIYHLRNIEDGSIITRVRVLKKHFSH